MAVVQHHGCWCRLALPVCPFTHLCQFGVYHFNVRGPVGRHTVGVHNPWFNNRLYHSQLLAGGGFGVVQCRRLVSQFGQDFVGLVCPVQGQGELHPEVCEWLGGVLILYRCPLHHDLALQLAQQYFVVYGVAVPQLPSAGAAVQYACRDGFAHVDLHLCPV